MCPGTPGFHGQVASVECISSDENRLLGSQVRRSRRTTTFPLTRGTKVQIGLSLHWPSARGPPRGRILCVKRPGPPRDIEWRNVKCQVTVVSPFLFRRHWTERPTWPAKGRLGLAPAGSRRLTMRGPLPGPCASAANVRAFLRAALHPRPRLCRFCALAVPLGTPACAGPPSFGEGTFLSAREGHRQPSTVSWRCRQSGRLA